MSDIGAHPSRGGSATAYLLDVGSQLITLPAAEFIGEPVLADEELLSGGGS